jgi:hypothetical protein
MIGDYLAELERSLRSRGRSRRRFLTECRHHLEDLAAARGEINAVEVFGQPATVAAAFDLEVAAQKVTRATWAVAIGVCATSSSTLALIHAATPGVTAPLLWAVVFFACAQVAIVAVALATLQALRLRRSPGTACGLALLCRRCAIGVAASLVTMFAAGAALPGQGSAGHLLSGPILAATASILLLRAWVSTRRLAGAHELADDSPFDDLRALTGLRVPAVGPLLLAAVAALCAFGRDLGEAGSSTTGSLAVAAVEAGLVIGSYLLLRRPLGLRSISVAAPLAMPRN